MTWRWLCDDLVMTLWYVWMILHWRCDAFEMACAPFVMTFEMTLLCRLFVWVHVDCLMTLWWPWDAQPHCQSTTATHVTHRTLHTSRLLDSLVSRAVTIPCHCSTWGPSARGLVVYIWYIEHLHMQSCFVGAFLFDVVDTTQHIQCTLFLWWGITCTLQTGAHVRVHVQRVLHWPLSWPFIQQTSDISEKEKDERNQKSKKERKT